MATEAITFIITPQTIITAGGVVGAIILLVGKFANGVRFVDRQRTQDDDIHNIQDNHDKDMKAMTEALRAEFSAINKEQQILTEGVLACLKGLSEQGCNGPVTKAIEVMEAHLNAKAHPSSDFNIKT